MAGIKTIVNNSNVVLSVVLQGRVGAEPSSGNLPPVSGSIPPHGRVTFTYGNDQNPFLNLLEVRESSNGSNITEIYTSTQRGGPGTLDNLFNTNSILTLTYNPTNYSFTLTGSN